jgi:hypothetical protein
LVNEQAGRRAPEVQFLGDRGECPKVAQLKTFRRGGRCHRRTQLIIGCRTIIRHPGGVAIRARP